MKTLRRFAEILPLTVTITSHLSITGPIRAVECNVNNCPSEGCEVTGNDCNNNDIDDEVDIEGGTSEDCNGNRIPDGCELDVCQPIDVVFLIDASNSMNDLIGPIVCPAVDSAIHQLDQQGICVRSEKLALVPGQDVPCTESFCCEGDAFSQYGTVACEYFDVEAQNCGGCGAGSCEDWAPATAVVAAEKDWTPGPRIIVPISEQGPRCGDPLDDDDDPAIEYGVPIVPDNRLIVVTIPGNLVC